MTWFMGRYDYWHCEFAHLPASQTMPQPPQLARSVLVFTQVPPTPLSFAPQRSKPPGHTQLAALHTRPASHLWPQLPQFPALESVFTQTGGVPHSWLLAGHWHVPPWQMRPPVQATPQPPQFAESVLVSTQAPVQAVSPVPHVV
jgi:hypothetical protein